MEYTLKNGTVVKIKQDTFGESPREWYNLARMIFFGKYSCNGDKHNFNANDYEGWKEMKKAISNKLDAAVIVPVYMYVHSGATISTKPFSCPWDSGQLGFAVVTKKDLRENYSIKRCTQKYIEKAKEHIEAEVNTLDQYIRGDVYGFEIEDKNGNCIDSCCGFYGHDITTNGMEDHIDAEIFEELKELV